MLLWVLLWVLAAVGAGVGAAVGAGVGDAVRGTAPCCNLVACWALGGTLAFGEVVRSSRLWMVGGGSWLYRILVWRRLDDTLHGV